MNNNIIKYENDDGSKCSWLSATLNEKGCSTSMKPTVMNRAVAKVSHRNTRNSWNFRIKTFSIREKYEQTAKSKINPRIF